MRNSANLEAGRKYLVEIQAEYRDEPERIEAFNQLMRDFADNRSVCSVFTAVGWREADPGCYPVPHRLVQL